MRILFVEDDARTAAFVRKGLKEAGFTVHHVADGVAGRLCALHESYDVAILDLNLPGLDGLAILAAMREARITTPVIILSARNTVDDKVAGLRAGGDDYLTKPFAFAELIERVQSLLRRAAPAASAPTRLTVADLEIDLLSRRVTRAGQRIELQPREYAVLEYLMRNAGRVVTKTMIIEHVWEYGFDPQTNIVESRMSKLRIKIDEPFEQQLIQTIRGVGYVLGSKA